MRGSGGRGRALGAEEGHTSQRHSALSPGPHTQGQLGAPLCSKRCFLQKLGPQDRWGPLKVGPGSMRLQPLCTQRNTSFGRHWKYLRERLPHCQREATWRPAGRQINRLGWAGMQSGKASWRWKCLGWVLKS